MSSTTLTETFSASPPTYGKLRYIPAGYTPMPISRDFLLPETSEFGDERIMPLHDIRPLPTVDQLPTAKEGTAQLLTHGFTALKSPSIMHSAPYTQADWQNPELVQKLYVPEMEEMLKRITGAKKVITEIILLRSSAKSEQDIKEAQIEAAKKGQTPNSPPQTGTASSNLAFPRIVGFSPIIGGMPPAPKVHLDYAPAGARAHIRLFHPTVTAAFAPVIAAEDRLLAANLPLDTHYSTSPDAPRWAIYSLWRPLKPVKRDPLALGDVRSFAEEDYVTVDVPAPTLDSEGGRKDTHIMKAYVSRGREGHRWCYVSEQKPDEILVVGLWDSDREGDSVGAGGVMHSSVELEGQEGKEPRESLELRCLAIW